jgi:hypothetical protein
MKITFNSCFNNVINNVINNSIVKVFDLIATPIGGILGVLAVLRLPFEINANHFTMAWFELVFFMLFMVAAFSGHSRYTEYDIDSYIKGYLNNHNGHKDKTLSDSDY